MNRYLVTGANKGIGLAIVSAILEKTTDSTVLLGSRSSERGEAARQSLIAKHPNWSQRVRVLEVDVSSDASVEDAAQRVASWYDAAAAPLTGLVNNAGIGGSSLADVLDVNVYGMRRVCEAFLPLLPPSGGRIVNVTSASGPSFLAQCSEEQRRKLTDPNIDWNTLSRFMQECMALASPEDFSRRGLADGSPYGLSKACANAYTLSLARENPRHVVNACTPGFIETDMTRPFATTRDKSPAEMGMKPPEAGTVAPCFLLLGEPQGSGHFYGSDAQRSPLDRYRAPGTPAYTGVQ